MTQNILSDFLPPETDEIDISEVVNAVWIKLDKLMRLPVVAGYRVQIGGRDVGHTREMGRSPSIAEVESGSFSFAENGNIRLCDYIDNLQLGFSVGKLITEIMMFQAIDPDYEPERGFRIVVAVFIDDHTRPIAKAAIAGPSIDMLREYIESL